MECFSVAFHCVLDISSSFLRKYEDDNEEIEGLTKRRLRVKIGGEDGA
jgi:hypothetical protein